MIFIHWIRSWFGATELTRSMYALDHRLSTLQARSVRAETALARERKRLEAEIESYEKVVSNCKEAIRRVEEANRRLSAELETTHEALKACHEVIIPGLVAANKTFQDSWDAQSSMLVMRSVAVKQQEEE